MTIKKTLILSLALAMAFCLGACKSRASGQPEMKKGARENVIVSENPRNEENMQSSSAPESSAEESSEPEKDPVPEEMANSLLSAIKSGVRENIQAYADYNTLFNLTEGQGADWLLRQVLMRLNYEVISSDVTDDKALVTIKLSNLDMNLVLPLYFEQAMAISFENASEGLGKTREELDAEYREVFTGLLAQHENSRRDKLTEIELEKKDGQWKINPTPALGDAVLGGFLTAQDSVRGDMQSSSSKSVPAASSEPPSSSGADTSGDEYADIDLDSD